MRNLYFSKRLYAIITSIVVLLVISFAFNPLFAVLRFSFFVLLVLVIADTYALFRINKGIHGIRFTPDKLSNGDENELKIHLENRYGFKVSLEVFDEMPFQFQIRDLKFDLNIDQGSSRQIIYNLRPVKRGEYNFGAVNVLVSTPFRLAKRRYRFSEGKIVPVYPSYIQMRKYELLAISNNLTDLGIKKIRRIGHNMEFEQIKEYVQGDDVRTINWKATARRNELMVNSYQDERSQQVYCLIDKGRVMQMPFDGLTLLDYAINTSLVISNIAIKKEDKAGIITFQHKVGNILPASKRNSQMFHIQELLYNQKTSYRESDFSRLFAAIRNKLRQRSLLLLFTNFESKVSLQRQLSFLSALAKSHVVVVIFFENTELNTLLTEPANDLRSIYHKAVGEKFAYEKKLIVKELMSHGIYSVLTQPQEMTVNTINKYLELKARGVI